MNTMKRLAALTLATVLLVLLAVPASAAKEQEITLMPDMHVMHSYNTFTQDSITDSYGNEYSSNVFGFDSDDKAYVCYELKGQYLSFTGTLLASTETDSSAKMHFAIFADGEEVFTVTNYTRQKEAVEISLDLTGVNVLEFKSRDISNSWNGYLYIAGGTFSREKDTQEVYPQWDTLHDVVLIDSKEYSYSRTLWYDVYGELYSGWYEFNSYYGAYAMYNLNKAYETFSGYIFPEHDLGENAVLNVTFYVDDQEVYTVTDIKKLSEAVYFEIDVTDAKTLKIQTSCTNDIWSTEYVYVANVKLSKHMHTPGDWTVDTAPTCTQTGVQTMYCTECGEVVKTETLPVLDHTPNGTWEITKEPTCTAVGEQFQLCTVCGSVALEERIPATGHIPGEIWETVTEATCTAVGEEVLHCTVCDTVTDRRAIPMKEHTVSAEWKEVQEATCEEEGLQIKECTVCATVLEEEVLPVIDHEFGQWKTIKGSAWNPPVIKERTCKECGKQERTSDNSTAWVKPTVIGVIVLLGGGGAGMGLLVLRKKRSVGAGLHSDTADGAGKYETTGEDYGKNGGETPR